jgi:hypothetical protein
MSLLPSSYLDAVVSIEVEIDAKFSSIATGFLVGFLTGKSNAEGQPLYGIYLVTNRHVFEKLPEVSLRFNKGRESKRYRQPLVNDKGEKIWHAHPNKDVDVAVFPVADQTLKDDKVDFFWISEELMAFRDRIKSLGIAQGDEIFVLGFPMGIAGKERKYVIARGGIIARLDDEIMDTEHSFIIDAPVFPGNSGGPVILKPAITSIAGTTPVNQAYLLGLVSSYITYEETACSLQTGKPRIVFVENSGLANVVPLDYVREIVTPLLPKPN